MRWTDAPAGSALHDENGKLVAVLKVRPMGITARWMNGMKWDISDQARSLSVRAAKNSPVRAFRSRAAAKTEIARRLGYLVCRNKPANTVTGIMGRCREAYEAGFEAGRKSREGK
jgi:hypothetical protein